MFPSTIIIGEMTTPLTPYTTSSVPMFRVSTVSVIQTSVPSPRIGRQVFVIDISRSLSYKDQNVRFTKNSDYELRRQHHPFVGVCCGCVYLYRRKVILK